MVTGVECDDLVQEGLQALDQEMQAWVEQLRQNKVCLQILIRKYGQDCSVQHDFSSHPSFPLGFVQSPLGTRSSWTHAGWWRSNPLRTHCACLEEVHTLSDAFSSFLPHKCHAQASHR